MRSYGFFVALTVLASSLTSSRLSFAEGDAEANARAIARLEGQVHAHEEELRRLQEERNHLRVSGYVQTEWVPYRQSSQDEVDPSTGAPLNENRFTLRRGRLRVDADRGIVSAAFELEANTVRGIQVRPFNAEGTIRWPATGPTNGGPHIAATVGLFLSPFGHEAAEADGARPFLERTTGINAFFPSSPDLGVRIRGGYRFITYTLAIMNGDPIGERAFPGLDPNRSKDFIGRIAFDGRVSSRVRVDGGATGLSGQGFHAGAAPTKDVFVWRDVNENGVVETTEIQVIAGGAGTPSENFKRFALGGDLRLHVDVPVLGEFAARAELVRASNLDRGYLVADPVASGRDFRELAWHVGFVQELTSWGLVGLRYDRYDPDIDASEQRALKVVPLDRTHSTLSVMGAFRYGKSKLVLQFDHVDNFLGRNPDGAPARLADDRLTLRAQVGF